MEKTWPEEFYTNYSGSQEDEWIKKIESEADEIKSIPVSKIEYFLPDYILNSVLNVETPNSTLPSQPVTTSNSENLQTEQDAVIKSLKYPYSTVISDEVQRENDFTLFLNFNNFNISDYRNRKLQPLHSLKIVNSSEIIVLKTAEDFWRLTKYSPSNEDERFEYFRDELNGITIEMCSFKEPIILDKINNIKAISCGIWRYENQNDSRFNYLKAFRLIISPKSVGCLKDWLLSQRNLDH
jgi:hypothetical protein